MGSGLRAMHANTVYCDARTGDALKEGRSIPPWPTPAWLQRRKQGLLAQASFLSSTLEPLALWSEPMLTVQCPCPSSAQILVDAVRSKDAARLQETLEFLRLPNGNIAGGWLCAGRVCCVRAGSHDRVRLLARPHLSSSPCMLLQLAQGCDAGQQEHAHACAHTHTQTHTHTHMHPHTHTHMRTHTHTCPCARAQA